MKAQDIITKFELYVDDGTELSLIDELALLNKMYSLVCDDRPWEFLKKNSNTISVINGYATLPTDFGYIYLTEYNGEQKKIVYVDGIVYEVINFSDRRSYLDKTGYCWVNNATGKLEFSTPINGTLDMDYIYVPSALTILSEPIFPERFQHVLYHLMAFDDYAIQQFDKAKSYANENKAKAEDYLTRMRLWNANLIV